MILPELNVLKPRTLYDALHAWHQHPDAKPVAGGTDLLVLLKQRTADYKNIIDVSTLDELQDMTVQDECLCIGAGVTLAAIEESDLIRRDFAALAEAARSVASPNLRNMATLGGNLCLAPRCFYYNQSLFWRDSFGQCLKTGGGECFAVPGSRRCFACFSADCPPALIALGATVTLARYQEGVVTERRVSLENLYRDDGIRPLTLAPQELMTAVQLPLHNGIRSTYRKYRQRASIDFPLAGVAVAFSVSEGKFCNVRIVLNAMASAPVLAGEAAKILEGNAYSEEMIAQAMTGLTRNTHPVRNQQGSPEHRRRMTRILFRRGVEKLLTG